MLSGLYFEQNIGVKNIAVLYAKKFVINVRSVSCRYGEKMAGLAFEPGETLSPSVRKGGIDFNKDGSITKEYAAGTAQRKLEKGLQSEFGWEDV